MPNNLVDCKQFFKPQISKTIIILILLFLFGVPAYLHSCNAYLEANTPQQCTSPHLTLYNYFTHSFTTGVLDISFGWDFNSFIITLYIVVLYLMISLVFLLTGYNWKKAALGMIGLLLILLLIRILMSLYNSKVYAI